MAKYNRAFYNRVILTLVSLGLAFVSFIYLFIDTQLALLLFILAFISFLLVVNIPKSSMKTSDGKNIK